MTKRALITGITGQDGSYLAELLLKKGYKVYGVTRRTSTPNYERIRHIVEEIELIPADLLDQHSLTTAVKIANPDEVYNLAAQSLVPVSWHQPVLTGEFTALGVTRILEALRLLKPDAKFYQASSSEMFGKAEEVPQNEKTPFHPRSPYAVAKVYGHWITINYRESYKMFCVSGILFNHESERRGLEFVTRKVCNSVAKIKLGLAKDLKIGNLDSRRDWGYAPEYVNAMWLMIQQEKPEDFVIGTGESHSVRELIQEAFLDVGIRDWDNYVKVDPGFLRPADVENLVADASKAKKILNWRPRVKFTDLVAKMVKAEMETEEKNLRNQRL